MSAFAEPGYQAINAARLAHLAGLGLKLSLRSVLEVGAGVGDLTGFFLERECLVTATDGRPENVEALRARFAHDPAVDVAHLDAGVDWAEGPWSVVFCYGLLYHLADPRLAIERFARACTGQLLLETCVTPDSAPGPALCFEDPADHRNALDGIGCRPRRADVMGWLRESFPYAYATATQPDHEDFPTDWTAPLGPGNHRGVFVASRTALPLASLTPELRDRQEVYRG